MRTHAAKVACAASAAAVLLPCLAGCARPSLVERALAARGGRLTAFTREVEARVDYGFPGVWRWEFAYRFPESFRLSFYTTGATQHYVFDGRTLSSHLGSVLVSHDSHDVAAYRSIASWLGVTSLAFLADPTRATWKEVPAAGLGRDVVRALSVRLREDGARYALGFDAKSRLVAAKGPIEIPGIGAGRLAARFRDFRSVDGHDVPFAATYRLNDEPFFEEHVIRFLPGLAVLDPAALTGSEARR